MDISILGYKINIEVLILIGIVYLILVGHMFCGCYNFGLMEGMENATETSGKNVEYIKKKAQTMDLPAQQTAGTSMNTVVSTQPSVPTTSSKEGFTGANINYGESSVYDLSSDTLVNTSSWSAPNMTVVPGQPLNAAVKKFMAREPQPLPLPEGEMLLFANTPFKPECCPNTYSNSSGCACMTGKQYNYMVLRGGNNVPYSEY